MDIETDNQTITIQIREHASITIQNLNSPSFAFVGDDFHITYDAVNNGGEQNCYCKVMEGTTQLDRIEMVIGGNSTVAIDHLLNFSTNGNKTLVVEVGYVE